MLGLICSEREKNKTTEKISTGGKKKGGRRDFRFFCLVRNDRPSPLAPKRLRCEEFTLIPEMSRVVAESLPMQNNNPRRPHQQATQPPNSRHYGGAASCSSSLPLHHPHPHRWPLTCRDCWRVRWRWGETDVAAWQRSHSWTTRQGPPSAPVVPSCAWQPRPQYCFHDASTGKDPQQMW